MLFNSITFAVFLPIVFLIYWVIGYARLNAAIKLVIQNGFIIVASYVFYGWWDWRFLLLIAFTSFCSWGSGLLIGQANTQSKAKAWMIANVILNLGILAIFKYYDFFVSELGRVFGMSTDNLLLRIILPVGISFYTFQALSYSIDVYRRKMEPTKDIVAFFAFISFFPQLVAGPIERATNLLPQFQQNRTFNYAQAVDGMRQILWGLFKKMVIADNCATYVDQVWSTYSCQNGSTLLLAAVLFTFQIYGDFSGYSDIAIGTAKLFGIKLMRNFNVPYFSRDIAEFWRRWHISLTTWFRDYVYIPLGGSRPEIPPHVRNAERYKKWIIVRNTFVIFLVSGFWHGANWTFIAWGAYHALLFLPLILLGKNRKYTNQIAEGCILPSWREALQMLLTFILVVIGWMIFRAETISQAWDFMSNMCTNGFFCKPYIQELRQAGPLTVGLLMMIVLEWWNRAESHGLAINKTIPWHWVRPVVYLGLAMYILYFGKFDYNQFIYFQF
ncbi:MAG: MBOAT family protein [Paludibacteraceae bacterium]|nr:MBOAT family protein [Paludibacteraceae bacterium]